MDANVINELKSGLNAAYINGSVAANLAYKPVFVSNNPEDGKKVISSVEDELCYTTTNIKPVAIILELWLLMRSLTEKLSIFI